MYFLITSYFPPISSTPPPQSGNLQNVLCTYESVSILLDHLFCFLDLIFDRFIFNAIFLFIFFIFFFSGNLFISPLILVIVLSGRIILIAGPCLLSLNISCQFLLVCSVSVEKSADSLMGAPLYVTNCFSLAAFKIFSVFNLLHFN